MEYDRALYRVYERIMEDLNASPSPMATHSSNATSATNTSNGVNSAGAGPYSPLAIHSPTSIRSPATQTSSTSRTHRRRRRRRILNPQRENQVGSGVQEQTPPTLPTSSSSQVDNGNPPEEQNDSYQIIDDGAIDTNHSFGIRDANVTNGYESVRDDFSDNPNNNTRNDIGDDRAQQRRQRSRRRSRRGRRGRRRDQQQPQLSRTISILSNNMPRNQNQPLPFMMPIWMANKLEELKGRIAAHGTLNSVNGRTGLGSSNRLLLPILTGGDDRQNNPGLLFGVWLNIRHNLSLASSGGFQVFNGRVDGTERIPSSPSSSHRDSDEEYPMDSLDDDEGGAMGIGDEEEMLHLRSSPSEESREGLRRRAASISSLSSPNAPHPSTPSSSARVPRTSPRSSPRSSPRASYSFDPQHSSQQQTPSSSPTRLPPPSLSSLPSTPLRNGLSHSEHQQTLNHSYLQPRMNNSLLSNSNNQSPSPSLASLSSAAVSTAPRSLFAASASEHSYSSAGDEGGQNTQSSSGGDRDSVGGAGNSAVAVGSNTGVGDMESVGNGGGMNATSLVQRAIQMQLRQTQLMSSPNNRQNRQDRRSGSVGSGTDSEDDYDSVNNDDSTSSDEVTMGDSDGEDFRVLDVALNGTRPNNRTNRNNRRSNNSISSSPSANSSNSSSSSSSQIDDDPSGGCSQQNVYITMRLSFSLGVLHLFVLFALHVTYVGPYAFKGRGISAARGLYSNMGENEEGWRRLLTRGLLSWNFEDWSFRNLKQNNDSHLNEGGSDQLINCISYALSTRSPEKRSNYFSLFGSGDDSRLRRQLLEVAPMDYSANARLSGGSISVVVDDDADGDDDANGREFLTYEQYWQRSVPETPASFKEASTPLLGKDEILQIRVLYGGKCTGQCSRVRTVHQSDDVLIATTSNIENNGEKNDEASTSMVKNEDHVRLLQNVLVTAENDKNEVLTKSILHGYRLRGHGRFAKRSQKSGEQADEFRRQISENQQNFSLSLNTNTHDVSVGSKSSIMENGLSVNMPANNRRQLGERLKVFSSRLSKSIIDDDENGSSIEDEYSSQSFWDEPHYRFSIDDALLYMDYKAAYLHNITLVNVTVTERCLSTGSDNGKLSFWTAIGEFLSQIYGMDSIIINQLMYGVRSPDGSFQGGHLQSVETKERWGWRKEQLESYEHNGSFIEWIFKKIGILSMSLVAFFLITSVTSLIVRVLTSSGVVLMFPLFACLRACGMPGADERILALSYPWIGHARGAIANQQIHPQSHLVWAHIAKIILYYVMYEACQAAWSVVLYAKSIPEALPVWIYGFAMIWEYFSMVFVRSALSVHFFPRITLLYFAAYHMYFYSVPYGYFDVALVPLFLFMTHAMLYTMLALEAPNAARGSISVDCPREVYNKLSWPEWNAQLPSEWTMFLPINSRHTPLHDREVPEGGASAAGSTSGNGIEHETGAS